MTMEKEKIIVGVVFGGRSVEHEVSVITGLQVIENMDRERYVPLPIYISHAGLWYTGEDLLCMQNYADLERLVSRLKRIFLVPASDGRHVLYLSGGIFSRLRRERLDVVFPALHGTYGEDGCLPGLLEMCGVPYVGARVLASSVGMDKIVMKGIFREAGLPVVRYVWFERREWEAEPEGVLARVEGELGYPVVVKPANLGSSVGISRVNCADELRYALDVASHYDHRLLVEEGLEEFMEVNCAVMGRPGELMVSVCEQPVSWEAFLTYEEKYLREGKGKGLAGCTRKLPAPIDEGLTCRIQELAKQAFLAVDCQGVARIDFLLDKGQEPLVNEINTMPGSVAFYLWEPLGISFSELIHRLIQLAFETHEEAQGYIRRLDTNILSRKRLGGKGQDLGAFSG